MELETLIHAALTEPEAGWNMGSFGAIAEFHHVAGDPMPTPPARMTLVIGRGGLRIERLDGVRPVAWELLSPKTHRWSHGISLCLPHQDAAMNGRTVLTDLGPDTGALRPQDQDAILFDMGLGQYQVDFCIRTDDPALLEVLRANTGRSLFDHDNHAMGAILKTHPARVALTRLGRVEVYQMIGGPDTGGKSPEGPHTHVLPKLLRAGRTHSANTPIPQGWVPCANLHPENPVIDRLGGDKELNATAFAAFQELLGKWGSPEYLAGKALFESARSAAQGPQGIAEPGSRLGRAGLRNAIRQARRHYGDTPLIAAWAEVFDSSGRAAEDADDAPQERGH